jgi:hypothetical protein
MQTTNAAMGANQNAKLMSRSYRETRRLAIPLVHPAGSTHPDRYIVRGTVINVHAISTRTKGGRMGGIFRKLGGWLVGLAFLPAIGVAAAAPTPYRIGWVWANSPNASAPYTPPSRYIYDSARKPITVSRIGIGVYAVTFDDLADGAPDDVQVSAYGTNGYCISAGWARSKTTIVAYVHCDDATGKPANTAFTLLYQSRGQPFGASDKGIAFLTANAPKTASYSPEKQHAFNSAGGTMTITRSGVGRYMVFVPGLTATKGSDAQVTAYMDLAHCKPGAWTAGASGTSIEVRCYGKSGHPVDARFNLAYALREPFGLNNYGGVNGVTAWSNQAAPKARYTPDPDYQYNSLGFLNGNVTVVEQSTGQYSIQVPNSFGYDSSVVLVTAHDASDHYCNVVSWVGTGTHLKPIMIGCYGPGGAPASTQFDVTFECWFKSG